MVCILIKLNLGCVLTIFSNWRPSTINYAAYISNNDSVCIFFSFNDFRFVLLRLQAGAACRLYKHHSKQWSVVIVGLFKMNLNAFSKEASKHQMLALPTEVTPVLCFLCVYMFALFDTGKLLKRNPVHFSGNPKKSHKIPKSQKIPKNLKNPNPIHFSSE